MTPNPYHAWRKLARDMKQETLAIALCLRDRRTPWLAKLLAGGVVAYALSPLDLIPDFIPVLGHLDDLVIVPLGILAVRRLIPERVLADCRQQAAELVATDKPVSWCGAGIILGLWLAAIAATLYLARLLWPAH